MIICGSSASIKSQFPQRRSRVFISPTFPKIFWRYYNKGWRIASEARFRLMKGNVVESFIVFKKDVKPYGAIQGSWAIQGSFANCNISLDLDLFNGGIIEYI
jgi:hypothetical protein